MKNIRASLRIIIENVFFRLHIARHLAVEKSDYIVLVKESGTPGQSVLKRMRDSLPLPWEIEKIPQPAVQQARLLRICRRGT